MEVAALIVITLIVLFIIWRGNNLPLFEKLAIWLFVSTLNINLVDIFIANLKLIKIDKQMFWPLFLNRYLLIPLVVLLFIDLFSKKRRWLSQLFLFVSCVLLLTLIEYSTAWIGIYNFVKWKISWSLIEWSSIILSAIYCRRFMRYLLMKGNG